MRKTTLHGPGREVFSAHPPEIPADAFGPRRRRCLADARQKFSVVLKVAAIGLDRVAGGAALGDEHFEKAFDLPRWRV